MVKKTVRVLVSDKLAPEGVEILKQAEGVEVTVKTGMSPDELKAVLPQFDAIIIRSATKLTADVLAAAPGLKAIARAGVGVDNVDIAAATKNGTIVMNTPGGNTLSAAELTLTLLSALCRHVAPACARLKEGVWDKKSFEGVELSGKTIGIVGLGRIGCEVAKRCAAFNMRVLGYDPFLTEARAQTLGITLVRSVDELVREADFLTVHTPLNDETRGMIGAKQFALMKKGVRVVNVARGGIIDEAALLDALQSGRCAGAALDVFTEEPPTDRALVEHPKVLCTPHLGASTEEAQVSVTIDAARQIVDVLKKGEIRSALNYPALSVADAEELAPYGVLAMRLGRLAGQIFEGPVRRLELTYGGEIVVHDLRSVTHQFAMGLMSCFEEHVNPVSAPILAKERGIDIRVTQTEAAQEFRSLIRVEIETGDGVHKLAGTIFGRRIPLLVMLDDFFLEVAPQGTLLLIRNEDRPGVIGAVGTALGNAGINIAGLAWGSLKGEAMSVVRCDAETIPPEILQAIGRIPFVKSVRMVRV
ncbi:MAG: phosphoglycerate dehydrogenase [Planctomycetota bacterium]